MCFVAEAWNHGNAEIDIVNFLRLKVRNQTLPSEHSISLIDHCQVRNYVISRTMRLGQSKFCVYLPMINFIQKVGHFLNIPNRFTTYSQVHATTEILKEKHFLIRNCLARSQNAEKSDYKSSWPSVLMGTTLILMGGFSWNFARGFFENFEKIQVPIKFDMNNGYVTRRSTYIYDIADIIIMRNIFIQNLYRKSN